MRVGWDVWSGGMNGRCEYGMKWRCEEQEYEMILSWCLFTSTNRKVFIYILFRDRNVGSGLWENALSGAQTRQRNRPRYL